MNLPKTLPRLQDTLLYPISVLLILLICCNNLFAQSTRFTSNPIDIPPSAEHPDGMLEIDSEIDNYSASYLPDVEYVKRGDRSLRLQLLTPGSRNSSADAIPHPVIVYVQGSAWLPQNLYTALPQLSEFARRGYFVASVEYRPSTEAIAPAQIQDVLTAIRFLRANAKQYNLDTNRFGIWGDSSGGHMATLAVTAKNSANFVTDDYADQSMDIQAVVNFYGPTNFREMDNFPSQIIHNAENSPESRVVGNAIQAPEATDLVTAYNPITYIDKDSSLPPFLIMHGDEDPLVPFNQSVLLYKALKKADKQVTFIKVKGGGHGTRFWTPGVLGEVQQFFEQYLKGEKQ